MQNRHNFEADQRFDLPYYESMSGLIESAFRVYNKDFFTSINKVLKGGQIVAGTGLEAAMSQATDSLFFNVSRVGRENLVKRLSLCETLTVELEPNSMNYVEIEFYETTSAEDAVAFWDTTANNGAGEEFIQNVDTILNMSSQRLISSVGAFTGLENRIPLAICQTDNFQITDITDYRDFMFSLEGGDGVQDEWDFGATRTDKTILSMNSNDHALKTVIKEMKGLDNWYDDQGITTLNLLERINYVLVGGGDINWVIPSKATGSITAIVSDPTTGIADGDTLTLNDGFGDQVFTFNTGTPDATPLQIWVDASATAASVRTAISDAIVASGLQITPSEGEGALLNLTNDNFGSLGNQTITESISTGSLSPIGMVDGVDGSVLSWSETLKVLVPSKNYTYEITAGSHTIADGQVAFVTLPAEGVTPSGALTVSVVDVESYILDRENTRNYIIAARNDDILYFGNAWSNVTLSGGETGQIGDGVSNQVLTAIGIVDEYDSTPPYFSTHIVTQGSSLTNGVSQLDASLHVLNEMMFGHVYLKHVTGPFTSGDYITLPARDGFPDPEAYTVDYNTVEVQYMGRTMRKGVDYAEDENLGSGLGNRIQILRDIPDDGIISFRIQFGGYQRDVGEANTASNIGSGEGAVYKTKSGVDLQLRRIKAGANMVVQVVDDDVILSSAGLPGSVWHTDAGAPGDGLGVDGDFYLDSSNGFYYEKIAGTWPLQGSLKGPQGDVGEGVPSGGSAGEILTKASGTDYDTAWASPTQYNSGWLTSDPGVSVAHGLSDENDITDYVVLIKDTTISRIQKIEGATPVVEWDASNIYLAFAPFSFTNKEYKIITRK